MCGLRAEVVGGDEATCSGEKGMRRSAALFSFLLSNTISKRKKMQGESYQNSASERKTAGRRAVRRGRPPSPRLTLSRTHPDFKKTGIRQGKGGPLGFLFSRPGNGLT